MLQMISSRRASSSNNSKHFTSQPANAADNLVDLQQNTLQSYGAFCA